MAVMTASHTESIADLIKKQILAFEAPVHMVDVGTVTEVGDGIARIKGLANACLLYTSDAADDLLCVDLGGRRIIKKKKQ